MQWVSADPDWVPSLSVGRSEYYPSEADLTLTRYSGHSSTGPESHRFLLGRICDLDHWTVSHSAASRTHLGLCCRDKAGSSGTRSRLCRRRDCGQRASVSG